MRTTSTDALTKSESTQKHVELADQKQLNEWEQRVFFCCGCDLPLERARNLEVDVSAARVFRSETKTHVLAPASSTADWRTSVQAASQQYRRMDGTSDGDFEFAVLFWMAVNLGSPHSLSQIAFVKKRKGSLEIWGESTAILFGLVFVMVVFAPDSGKDLEECAKFVWRRWRTFCRQDVAQEPKKLSHRTWSQHRAMIAVCKRWRRRGGQRDVRARMLAGLQRWPRWFFKKLMWYDLLKELNCTAASTWSSCDDQKEMAFTHRQWGENKQTSQLDYIPGGQRRTYTTKSSCAIRGSMIQCKRRYQKVTDQDTLLDRKRRRDGKDGSRMTKTQEMISKKKVMGQNGQAKKEGSETIQKHIEEAAKKVAHTTKSDWLKEANNTGKDDCGRRGSGDPEETTEKQEQNNCEAQQWWKQAVHRRKKSCWNFHWLGVTRQSLDGRKQSQRARRTVGSEMIKQLRWETDLSGIISLTDLVTAQHNHKTIWKHTDYNKIYLLIIPCPA